MSSVHSVDTATPGSADISQLCSEDSLWCLLKVRTTHQATWKAEHCLKSNKLPRLKREHEGSFICNNYNTCRLTPAILGTIRAVASMTIPEIEVAEARLLYNRDVSVCFIAPEGRVIQKSHSTHTFLTSRNNINVERRRLGFAQLFTRATRH